MSEAAAPAAIAELLIRRPIAEVFEAFVDPAVTTKFWFTKSSGRLEPGGTVQWTWEMFGATGAVSVKAIEPPRRIQIEWEYNGTMTPVEWTFTERGGDGTFVSIRHTGFGGDAAAATADAIGSTEGFALVLAGAKAWLEKGVLLGLMADRHPDALVEGWKA